MKSFVAFFCLISAVSAFVPQQVTKAAFKAAVAVSPAVIASPAFAADSIINSLPTTSLALEVQFGAYLAVLFGTFLPCLFLINLFVQTESRRAGREGGQDSE